MTFIDDKQEHLFKYKECLFQLMDMAGLKEDLKELREKLEQYEKIIHSIDRFMQDQYPEKHVKHLIQKQRDRYPSFMQGYVPPPTSPLPVPDLLEESDYEEHQ